VLPAIATHSTFVIRNVRVFDGDRIISANSVLVESGRIRAVGVDLKGPAGAQVIDGTGDTLVPGLIDSHVHAWTRDVLREALVLGNTTVLDMFMWSQNLRPWKEQEGTGATDIADFRTAGTCIATAGGHGSSIENLAWTNTTIGKPEEAQAAVDERIAQGSDYIKIMYDNGPRFAAMPKDVMEAIVTAVHKRGKMGLSTSSHLKEFSTS
jgi:urease alpha subunit